MKKTGVFGEIGGWEGRGGQHGHGRHGRRWEKGVSKDEVEEFRQRVSVRAG